MQDLAKRKFAHELWRRTHEATPELVCHDKMLYVFYPETGEIKLEVEHFMLAIIRLLEVGGIKNKLQTKQQQKKHQRMSKK